ncbi:MAG: alpha/beta fold hydrolase [Deltaproteobacteria bacterium]|nr:alpha/beta fold hydrolase [Deltaproteobacteria bacterium]
MIDISTIDYSFLDRPEILTYLFHPRPEWGGSGVGSRGKDLLIPVEDEIVIGGRFHIHDKAAPSILFFHGNGEIAADYDEMGPVYNQIGVNFLPVDYRGYGRSTGQPTITHMMRDCHIIFDFVKKWLQDEGCGGPFILMGRSLGSASVLELVSHYRDAVDGLIVESGFAFSGPLLQLLGVNLGAIGFSEAAGLGNLDKIRTFDKPTLIIHAELDHIIPFSDGQALYDASPASDKTLLKIPGANHNDIFMRGLSDYMAAIRTLTQKVMGRHSSQRPAG